MPRNELSFSVRARNARRAASDVDRVRGSVSQARREISGAERAARAGGRGVSAFGSAAGAAAGVGGIYGLYQGTKRFTGAGLGFNAMLEQNRVAFTNFLGSGEAADAKLTELFNLAKVTPFEFRELIEAQTRLMGFGMEAEQTTSVLRTLGDAVAGAGGGREEIKRATYALGQMAARGKVTQEELNQLAEARIPAQEILRKELGLTKAEMGRIGDEGIESGKAIAALQRGLDKAYGGQAAKQAKTYNGQLSMLRDNYAQMAGSVSKGLFEDLRKDALPALNATFDAVNRIAKRTDIGWDEKFDLSTAVADRELGPFASKMGDQITKALTASVEAAVPRMIDGAAAAAPKIAGALVSGFLNAGPWGQLLTTAVLAKKFGLLSGAGRAAGTAAGASAAAGMADQLPASVGARRAKMSAGLSGAARSIGRRFGILLAAEVALQLTLNADHWGGIVDKWADKNLPEWLSPEEDVGSNEPGTAAPGLGRATQSRRQAGKPVAEHPNMRRQREAAARERSRRAGRRRGPAGELAGRRGDANPLLDPALPTARGSRAAARRQQATTAPAPTRPLEVHSHVTVKTEDGRVLGKTVARARADEADRRGKDTGGR